MLGFNFQLDAVVVALKHDSRLPGNREVVAITEWKINKDWVEMNGIEN